ncbi:hypothetical protein ACVW0I_000329 [Bradyrhizobium sp. LM6.11]
MTPFGPLRRIQEAQKRLVDDHAVAESRAFGRCFKALEHTFGELNGNFLCSRTFVRVRLHLAIGTTPNRAALTVSLTIDGHCFFSSSIFDRTKPLTLFPRNVDFRSKQMNRPSDDAPTEGSIRP